MLKNRTKKGLKKLKEFSPKIGYQSFIFMKQKKTPFKDVFYIYLNLILLFATSDELGIRYYQGLGLLQS